MTDPQRCLNFHKIPKIILSALVFKWPYHCCIFLTSVWVLHTLNASRNVTEICAKKLKKEEPCGRVGRAG